MINEIELSEKFEQIFTNDEVNDFYVRWKEEKARRDDKRTKFQKIFPIILFASFIFIILLSSGYFIYNNYIKDRVEQSVFKNSSNEIKFTTLVWVNGEIVKSWWTPIDEITDSAKVAQKNQADAFLKLVTK